VRIRIARLACLGIVLTGASAFAQVDPDKKKEPPAKKAEKAAAPSLDDLIAQALRSNPDIRVAEAKVREAEAELERTRLVTARKVAELHHSIDTARKTRDEAKQRLQEVARMGNRGVITAEEVRAAQLTWERFVSEVAKLEAEMQALLGKLPGKLGQEKEEVGLEFRTRRATDAAVNYLNAIHLRLADSEVNDLNTTALAVMALKAAGAKAGPEGTIAERIRKALDTPINGDYKGKHFGEVFKDFEKKLDGIAFRIVVSPWPAPGQMDINLGQVPLGSAIQAVNDVLSDYRFVVRDYGILFTHKDMLPPGPLLLHDFWKSDVGREKPKGERDAKPKQ